MLTFWKGTNITTIDKHVQAKTQAIKRKELEQHTGHNLVLNHFNILRLSYHLISTTLDITRWSSRTVGLEPGHNGACETQHTESFLCVGGGCIRPVDQLLTLADELESIELEELESELGKTLFLESSYVAIESQS